MSAGTRTAIIIYDDYKNVLVVHKKNKEKNELWSLVDRELKGKETPEKCITKAVEKELGCTIFDLNLFKEYKNNSEALLVYTGIIREHLTLNKSISKVKWINKRDIDETPFVNNEMEIIKDFFESRN